jgi:hypothetical protein
VDPVYKIGIVNCHISKKSNLDNLVIVVKLMKLDICAVVETWFKKGEGKQKMEGALRSLNYEWLGKDREGRRGGGVGFLVKKGLKVRVAKTSRAEGILWVEAVDGEGKFFLAVVYRAPGTVPKVSEINQELMDELSDDITFFQEQGRVCVLGDFNSRIGELESKVNEGREGEREKVFKRKSKDKKIDKGGRFN